MIIYDNTDSTSSRALELAGGGAPDGTLVLAEEQSAGRGRSGNSFFSPGGGLYMSLILRAPSAFPLSGRAYPLTIPAAVAVCRAIERLTGLRPGIKWVNDVLLDDLKVCGILAESAGEFVQGGPSCAVLGIGVNLASAEFPPELRGIAGTLDAPSLSREELAAEIISELQALSETDALGEYRARSVLTGREISYEKNGATHFARVLGIDERGALVVCSEDGETTALDSGLVSVRRPPCQGHQKGTDCRAL